MIISDKTRATAVLYKREVVPAMRGTRRSQGSAGRHVCHVQKGRGRIRGRRKAVCVWEIMSNSVWLEDIICGRKLDCKAGEEVRNWVVPGFVWHTWELEFSVLGRVRTEHLLLMEMGSFTEKYRKSISWDPCMEG